MVLKIILDSNFLFVPSQFQVDIFEGLTSLLRQRFEPILLSPTLKEIQEIARKGPPKMRQQASLALKLSERCRVVDVAQHVCEAPDDVIVRVATKWNCPVATNDGALRKRLKNISVPVIYLRQKAHLELDGDLNH